MLRRIAPSWLQFAKNLTQTLPSGQTKVSLITDCRQHQNMSTADKKFEVIHDIAANEFRIPLKNEDGSSAEPAYLQYYEIKPGYVDLEHTVVPIEFRGHGIAKILAELCAHCYSRRHDAVVAKILAETAFDYFVEKKIDIRPTCTYLQKFFKENPLPRYKDHVKWDASL